MLAWASLICGVMAITSFGMFIVESKWEIAESSASHNAIDDPGNPWIDVFLIASPLLAATGLFLSLLIISRPRASKTAAYMGFVLSSLTYLGFLLLLLFIVWLAFEFPG